MCVSDQVSSRLKLHRIPYTSAICERWWWRRGWLRNPVQWSGSAERGARLNARSCDIFSVFVALVLLRNYTLAHIPGWLRIAIPCDHKKAHELWVETSTVP